MEEVQEHQFYIKVPDADEAISLECANVSSQSTASRLNYKWWILMAISVLFALTGQSGTTLLLRLYYENGGNSKWLATLVQTVGFPILYFFLIIPSRNSATDSVHTNQPSVLVTASIYIVLGLLIATVGILSSIGLLYLPVSTYSLIYASQLVFNAFFAFFLNSQKFTAFIVNSIFLLILSSTLLITQTDYANLTAVAKGQYTIGFLCTLFSAAGSGLLYSLIQLSFQNFLKRQTFRTILELIIYQSLVATCVILVGLFASGEWKDLKIEMEEFALGKLSYVMILIWIALTCQLYLIGSITLIFKVSAIFSNIITTLCFPVVPLLAVIIFHDKMEGAKVIALLLAIWGSASYTYQLYLDDCKSNTENENVNEVSPSEVSPTEID